MVVVTRTRERQRQWHERIDGARLAGSTTVTTASVMTAGSTSVTGARADGCAW